MTVFRILGYQLFLIVLSGSLNSCSDKIIDPEYQELIEKMGWLEKADPRVDAKKAILEKDYRYLVIGGEPPRLPGVYAECKYSDKDVRHIKGTIHGSMGYEHARLTALAEVYAEYYNWALRIHFEKAGISECPNERED